MPTAYSCSIKNKQIISKSSSGGVFYALASETIKLNGVVYGCVVKKEQVYHDRAISVDELLPMLGSKYVRSDMRDCYRLCANDLKNGKQVLFSGTPCQINALHAYLDNLSVNKTDLICLDVVCNGVADPIFWNKYLELNFKEKNISSISFRKKMNNQWNENFGMEVGDYCASIKFDPFLSAYNNDKIISKGCFNCKFKSENRKSDITIADFWGIENIDSTLKNKKGTSLVIIRNKKQILIDFLSRNCNIKEVPFVSSIYTNKMYYENKILSDNSPFDEKELIIKPIVVHKHKNQSIKSSIIAFLNKHRYLPNRIYLNKKPNSHSGMVGIITDHEYVSYGNRLQNYSLHCFLQNKGKKSYNIAFSNRQGNFLDWLLFAVRLKKRSYVNSPKIDPVYKASKRYEKRTFVFTNTLKKEKQLCHFETIIVGSDQIWNMNYHKYRNDLEYSLGNFRIINKPFKLVSYAASICMNSFSEGQKFLYRNSLEQFDSISVREKKGEELLLSTGINNVVTVTDPVFLLSKNDWNNAINKYKTLETPRDHYTFVYFLDDEGFCDNKYGRFVNCLNKDDPYYKANQFDFINLIRNSDLIVTDSFHALAFSVIFQKKVFLKRRKFDGMEARIEEIFRHFDFELEFDKLYDFSTCCYSLLNEHIKTSLDYLDKIFK